MQANRPYKSRRGHLAIAHKAADIIVLSANYMVQKATSETYPFYQDGHFYYLTGVNEPGWILVVEVKSGKDWLIAPERSDYLNSFEGEFNVAATKKLAQVDEIVENKEGWKRLKKLLGNAKVVGTPDAAPVFSETYGMFTNPSRKAFLQKITRKLGKQTQLDDIGPTLRKLRSVKDDGEIRLIKKAINITDGAIRGVLSKLNEYEGEYEVAADIAAHFMRHKADVSFNIIASGKNATVLHYRDNVSQLAKHQFLLMDIGAEHQRYASDISRTFAIGTVNKRHQAVYDAVKRVQDFALDNLKPGMTYREHELGVEAYMGQELRELKLIKGDSREEIRTFFPHATSHHLGLDVHDNGDYDMPFEPGCVITVEPGIYIPDEGIGVRIEDDVLITATGAENLSSHIPYKA